MNSELPILDFAIALISGALVGIERERKTAEDREVRTAGIRTFILFSMTGAVAAWLSRSTGNPWIFAASAICVTAIIIAGYMFHGRAYPGSFGLTTEMAAVVVFLLGGMTLFGHRVLAVSLAIATSAILAYKEPIHGWVGRLGRDDMYAVLRLLMATFIILPILPDRMVDPWGALNPYKMWLLVVLIAGLSMVGYVATRMLGARRGLPATGVAGGLVSSTAVALAFARRSRDARDVPGLADALATGILLSWGVMFVRVVVLVAVVNASLLRALAMPVAAMGVMTVLMAAVFYLMGARRSADGSDEDLLLKNPFSLTSAVKFAALFALVLLLVKLVGQYFPGQGVYWVAMLAGLTDVDAITLSMAESARGGDAAVTVNAIVIAILANTFVKCGLVVSIGAPGLRKRILLATAVVVLGVVVAYLVPWLRLSQPIAG